MQRFSEKAPSESVVLTFNFAMGLATGETLTGTPTITKSVIWGTDTDAATLVLGSPEFDESTTQVLVPVSAGTDYNDYTVSASCETSNPDKVLTWSGILPVRTYPSIANT
jgi:hypothetical protein